MRGFDMTKTIALAILLAASGWTTPAPTTRDVTWTGWFSDKGCAKIRDGEVGPSGTACVKKCLGDGAKPVFLSEQAKAIFEVRDSPSVIDDVGYRVEITGTVDDDAKTLSVKSVKHLSEVVSMCALPRKKGSR
jgi:hypothetical protein